MLKNDTPSQQEISERDQRAKYLLSDGSPAGFAIDTKNAPPLNTTLINGDR